MKNYEEIVKKLALIADMLVNTNLQILTKIEVDLDISNDDYVNLYLHMLKDKQNHRINKIPNEFIVSMTNIDFRIKRHNAS